MSASKRLNIIVSGMMAAAPHQGGATWAVLQYLLGFRKMGHEVYFVEPVKQAALRPKGSCLKDSENATYFLKVIRGFGLDAIAAPWVENAASQKYSSRWRFSAGTRVDCFEAIRRGRVKNLGASPEAFQNMISLHKKEPRQASGYQTQWE